MVAILILNWNGWDDTIDCIRSLLSMKYEDFFIILGDNGSTNDSKEQISNFCMSIGKNNKWLTTETVTNKSIEKKEIVLIDLKTNHGFAKGNNLMVKYAWHYNPEYYLLLNNDTEVEPDFLRKLVDFQKLNRDIKILSPLIYYFFEKNRIWNAGGKIIWGVRKYFYGNCLIKDIKIKEFLRCSYITGCALMCTPEVLKEDHSLLTEAFFHGEEDFELGLRMKKEKIKMGCYTPSVIYHKVGRSSGKVGDKIGKTYCYYLNRFINLRHNLNPISFYVFLCVYLPYVIKLLRKKGVSYPAAIKFYYKVIVESHKLDGVSYEKFNECIKKSSI